MRWRVIGLAVLAFAGCGAGEPVATDYSSLDAVPTATPRPLPSPEAPHPAVIRLVGERCVPRACAAREATEWVTDLLPETCGHSAVVCDSVSVLIPAARRMDRCRSDCSCPRLARELLDGAVTVLAALEEESGGVASCDATIPDCEVQEAGMLGPPAFDTYCG